MDEVDRAPNLSPVKPLIYLISAQTGSFCTSTGVVGAVTVRILSDMYYIPLEKMVNRTQNLAFYSVLVTKGAVNLQLHSDRLKKSWSKENPKDVGTSALKIQILIYKDSSIGKVIKSTMLILATTSQLDSTCSRLTAILANFSLKGCSVSQAMITKSRQEVAVETTVAPSLLYNQLVTEILQMKSGLKVLQTEVKLSSFCDLALTLKNY